MNTKNNHLFQKNSEAMKQAFIELLAENPINKVTVSEICKKAEVNRSTFYAHYVDVYDLLEKLEKEISNEMVLAFVGKQAKSMDEGFENIFKYIKDHADFYSAYFKNADNPDIVNAVIPEAYSSAIRRLVRQLGYKSESEYWYHESFFKAGLSGLIKLWLKNGCRETPKELSEILRREYSQSGRFFDWS
jgi:Transcriptional regulator